MWHIINSHVTIPRWSDAVEEILAGDQAVMLAHTTPASGVVLSPLSNFAIHDRDARTVAVNSSVAMWGKLERIRRNPRVALAFHTRAHSGSERPEYVLVQGIATIGGDDWHDEMGDRWERAGGQPLDTGRFWNWWLRDYHDRVNVSVSVSRMIVWPDLACEGAPQVLGTPLPDNPPTPQDPPARGTGPRIRHRAVARRARRLPDVLLGWTGMDGFPVVVPVSVRDTVPEGIVLEDSSGLVPPGGRRAGLTAHSFSGYVYGQEQHRHTGWLERTGERTVYAPHTRAWYRWPASRIIFNTVAGYGTRRGMRQARRAGIDIGWYR